MRLKVIALALSALLLSSSPALAEVTKEDLREMETRLKEYIDLRIRSEIGTVRSEIGTMRSEISAVRSEINVVRSEVNGLRSEMGTVRWLITVLIIFIAALIALPQTFGYLKERRESKEVTELRERLEALEMKMKT